MTVLPWAFLQTCSVVSRLEGATLRCFDQGDLRESLPFRLSVVAYAFRSFASMTDGQVTLALSTTPFTQPYLKFEILWWLLPIMASTFEYLKTPKIPVSSNPSGLLQQLQDLLSSTLLSSFEHIVAFLHVLNLLKPILRAPDTIADTFLFSPRPESLTYGV
ncbi:hypothetical protein SISNIDRAFT_456059 [Sistotremastrum niveocremeum HHB9708]|uniref:Uncharacterized protein n=1 Tax=Sistotremastrum niveocremeum HHB9708 TaxID=1314777 RepID=A0A164TEC8_9AGAM|nr:hypothetical protein SISNIDRAFT_456059 [Sistotremastrum niveocremeum HHB9708]